MAKDQPLNPKSFAASQLLFSSVQEDSRIEAELAARFVADRPAVTIASGGDTALTIAVRGVQVTAIDLNPAQIACCRLKQSAVQILSFAEAREFLLIDAGPGWAQLRQLVDPLTREFWDRHKEVLRVGLQRTGLAFQRLHWFRRAFWTFLQSRESVRDFLRLDNPAEQQRQFAQDWNGTGWHAATNLVFHPAVLGLVFRSNTLRSDISFAAVMRKRFLNMLTRSPARSNYYAWETFLGEFEAAVPEYLLAVEGGESARFGLVEFIQVDVTQWLADAATDSAGFIGLSNVPEFLTERQRHRLAQDVARVASPGAVVVVRAIFPRSALLLESEHLRLDAELTSWAEANDRSAFCNAFQIYRAEA